MCAESGDGTDFAEGRVVKGCKWREVEKGKGRKDGGELQRECERDLEPDAWGEGADISEGLGKSKERLFIGQGKATPSKVHYF